ncbi:acyl-CoA thioesterase [Sphingobium xenophagum]
MEQAKFFQRDAYPQWTKIQTHWADNDVYGHVNNAVHFRWFDTAINGWLIESGLLQIGESDLIGLVVETGCRYAEAVCYPEAIDLGFGISLVGRTSVTYRVGVFRKRSASPAAEGHFTHVFVDRISRRPVALPDSARSILATQMMRP